MMKPSAYLRTFGTTEIDSADNTISLSSREAALIAFLCSKRSGRATRQEVAQLFWPNVNLRRARHSLSQLLYALRPKVPSNLIVCDGESLGVSECRTDFIELAKDLKAGRLAVALSRYAGRFLPKDDLGSADLLDWRDQIEAEAAAGIASALQEQSCACGNSELLQVIEIAQQVLATHPDMGAAQVALLEAHARLGDGREVERLHSKFIRQGAERLPPIGSFLGRRASPQQLGTVRFAGREKELTALQTYWSDAKAGNGNVAVILGEPGIGKTRLADQFMRRVAIQGGTTWIARCCAATQRLPYSVVSEFLRENVTSSGATDNLALLPTSFSLPDHEGSEVASDEWRYQLTENLTSLVLEKCRDLPLVIFVDDVQWADDYTALLLSYWAYRVRSHSVLILLTVRTEEAEPPPDWIFGDLGRVNTIRLGRISVEAASEIVNAFETSNNLLLDSALRDAVLWQSGGRPFLLLEALSSLIGDDNSAKVTAETVLTESAESVLRRRFRNLTNEASCVLGALAVWGQEIDGDLLSRLADVRDESFAAALDLLHNRGIAYWHRGSVAFPHDLMREAAYRNLLPPTRALYHKRAAEHISDNGGALGLSAQHYAKAGESTLSAKHALRAAEDAIASYLYTDYEYYCRLCIEHGSDEQQRQAAARLSWFLVRVGRTNEIEGISHLLRGSPDQEPVLAISDLEHDLAAGHCEAAGLLLRAKSIINMAGRLNDLTAAPVVATLIDIAFDAGADEFGLGVVDALLPEAGVDSIDEAQISVESIVSVWRGVTDSIDVGLRQAEAALSRLSSCSSPTTKALCLSSYGTLLLLSGRIAEARTNFEPALDLATAAGDLRRQLCIINNNGIALLESGDGNGARHNFERMLTAPNVHSRIRGYGNLAILYYEMGDFAGAAGAAEAVLTMNASYKSRALNILGHSILGLLALESDIPSARNHAAVVQSLIQRNGQRSGDITYPTILLSKILLHESRSIEALQVLDDALDHVSRRDIPCTMRLKCQKALLLAQHDPDRAFAIITDVIAESSNLGAHMIAHRARSIRSQLVHV